jgi:DNA invertase Pin-like site-specific DNA recombinase
MNPRSFVAYYRVSTDRQGRSGLGLEAQRQAVQSFVSTERGQAVADFTEVETGKRADRPQLREALAACRRRKAVLVIAKLDRLARNLAFVANLMESGVEFVAVDMPHADRFTLHIFAALAEEEGRRISQRTRAALAAAKARGTVLGATGRVLAERNRASARCRAAELAQMIESLRSEGIITARELADALNARGIAGAGGGRWHPTSVRRMCQRI